MTPELKKACEVVFQEHKSAEQPIAWNEEAFGGKISIGLREMAKETLAEKQIIRYISKGKGKRTITILNPAASTAGSFEEAASLLKNGAGSPAILSGQGEPVKKHIHVSVISREENKPSPSFTAPPRRAGKMQGNEWYRKPFFYYVVWPLCAITLGILIAFFLSEFVEKQWQR